LSTLRLGETEGLMELFIFGRFRAREGQEGALAAALRDVIAPTHEEPGCLAIQAYRSTRDPGLFYIHSRWTDEAAFGVHAELPHTVHFVERVQNLIDHPLDVTRARPIG
jgi:quinol monooxygenase YgiN